MTERLERGGYRLEWIACKNLSVVWAQAQRKYREDRAREIADNFDPDLFDPIKVTLPNGNGVYHICDGQTRKGAVEMLYGKDELVPCLVAPEGNPVRAAELFLKTNTSRRPPTIIDNFKVSVTAKHPTEVAIDRIVRQHQRRVDNAGSKDAIPAVAALKYIFVSCSPKVLDLTLRALQDAWGDDRNAVSGPILRGFGMFLNEFAAYLDWKRFVETVKKKWTPGSLLRDAKAARDLHGGSTQEAIVQLLTSNYNRGLRTGKPLKRKQQPEE